MGYAPTFTPSPYIPLQVVTCTPIYTMEVSSSSRKIEKFSERLSIISLKEFRAAFSTLVYELEFKYGTNYIEAFVFNSWHVMCTMRHWMSTNNIFQRFWASPRSPI